MRQITFDYLSGIIKAIRLCSVFTAITILAVILIQTPLPEVSAAPSIKQYIRPKGEYVFPLRTTKSILLRQRPFVWCYTSQVPCHHNYFAADIFVPPGTTILAVKPGIITSSNWTGKFGQNVTIRGDDGRYYYYTHMPPNVLSKYRLYIGKRVFAGSFIGEVGTSNYANGTQPHLHFDVSTVPRPLCSAADCRGVRTFLNVQPQLVQAFNALPR